VQTKTQTGRSAGSWYDYPHLRPELLIGITRLRQDQLSVAHTVVGEHYIESGRGAMSKSVLSLVDEVK
jgi:hypothetical protein